MTSVPTLSHIEAHIKACEHQHRVVSQNHGTATVVELESLLSSHGTGEILKKSNPYEILSVVESRLDPRNHQVGCLFLLEHVYSNHTEELLRGTQGVESALLFSDFMRVSRSFLSSCMVEDYIGYSSVSQKKLGSLCKGVGHVALSCGIPKQVIMPLWSGLQCMVHGKFERITPVNHVVVQACIMAKCYWKALELLECQGRCLTLYEPQLYKTTEYDILLYFYSAGLAYTGLKKYGKAFDMFLGAMVMPVGHLRDVVVDAAKKYILVSLILHGPMKELPSYAPHVVKRKILSECENYMQLVEYVQNLHDSSQSTAAPASGEEVEEFVKARLGVWEKDGNLGLVNIVLELQKRRALKRLGSIYSCIQKSQAASELELTESYAIDREILRCEGTIHAQIDDKSRVVCFQDDQSTQMRGLLAMIQECLSMKQAIDEDSHQIQCSPAYIIQQETRKMASTSLK